MVSTQTVDISVVGYNVRTFLLCATIGAAVAHQRSYSFTLDTNSVTSAGVYDKTTHRMVHTLWSGVKQSAGINHFLLENNTMTEKLLKNPEAYDIKVVGSGGIQYTWEGVLGNTGPLTGPGMC